MVPNQPLVLQCRGSAWGLPTPLTVCRSTMEVATRFSIPIGRKAESRSIFPFLTAKPAMAIALELARLARYASLCQRWMAVIGPAGRPLPPLGTAEGGLRLRSHAERIRAQLCNGRNGGSRPHC